MKLNFHNKLKYKIKFGILCQNIKNVGVQRLTALLINYLYKIKFLKIYLFTTLNKEDDEYKIPIKIKRIMTKYNINNIIISVIKKKIDILIYQFYNAIDIYMIKLYFIIILHFFFGYIIMHMIYLTLPIENIPIQNILYL